MHRFVSPSTFALCAVFALTACNPITLAGGTGGSSSTGGAAPGSTSTSSDSGIGGSSSGTTSTSTTSPSCVDLDPSKYDQSCQTDDDCISVAAGSLCPGYNCSCPGGTINAAASAQYDALITSVPPGAGPPCECPATGTGRCIVGQCVWCPASYAGSGVQFVCPGDGG